MSISVFEKVGEHDVADREEGGIEGREQAHPPGDPGGVALIVESERRWADWSEGRPIELPDGQTWHFYRPEPLIRDGVPGWSFGAGTPEVDAVLSARFGLVVTKWGKAADDADRAAAVLEAAWFLLARNYRLTRAEFGAIMLRAAPWEAAPTVGQGQEYRSDSVPTVHASSLSLDATVIHGSVVVAG